MRHAPPYCPDEGHETADHIIIGADACDYSHFNSEFLFNEQSPATYERAYSRLKYSRVLPRSRAVLGATGSAGGSLALEDNVPPLFAFPRGEASLGSEQNLSGSARSRSGNVRQGRGGILVHNRKKNRTRPRIPRRHRWIQSLQKSVGTLRIQAIVQDAVCRGTQIGECCLA